MQIERSSFTGMQRRSYQPSQTKHRQGAGAEEVEFNGHGGHELLLSVINMKLSYLLFASNPTELICNLHHKNRAPSVLYQSYKSDFFQCNDPSEFITEMSKNNRFRINGLSRDPGSMNFGTLLKRHPKFVAS